MKKICSGCGTDKPVADFFKHPRGKYGRASKCRACKSLYEKKRWVENPDKARAASASWLERNKEKRAAYSAKYRLDNKERRNQQSREWRAANKEKVSENAKKWRINNPDKSKGYRINRRAVKKNAIPLWSEVGEIDSMYRTSRAMSVGGDEYHVDHIVPLQHPKVCGLHCRDNLRIISKGKNMKKNNKFHL